jgi:hypothetical protein
MSYTFEGEVVELNKEDFFCSGSVSYTYEPGDKGGPHSQPYSAQAIDIEVTITEAHDPDDEEVTDEKILKLLRRELVSHFENNQDKLTGYWEECAEETAAANRYDDYIERMAS